MQSTSANNTSHLWNLLSLTAVAGLMALGMSLSGGPDSPRDTRNPLRLSRDEVSFVQHPSLCGQYMQEINAADLASHTYSDQLAFALANARTPSDMQTVHRRLQLACRQTVALRVDSGRLGHSFN